MAHYYGTIIGNRGEASRLGTKSSGIDAGASGWNIGGKVYIRYNDETGRDEVSLSLTGGSNGRRMAQSILTAWIDGKNKLVIAKNDKKIHS